MKYKISRKKWFEYWNEQDFQYITDEARKDLLATIDKPSKSEQTNSFSECVDKQENGSPDTYKEWMKLHKEDKKECNELSNAKNKYNSDIENAKNKINSPSLLNELETIEEIESKYINGVTTMDSRDAKINVLIKNQRILTEVIKSLLIK